MRLRAQTAARRAPAASAVVAEHARIVLGHGGAVARARALAREHVRRAILVEQRQRAASELERFLDGIGDGGACLRSDAHGRDDLFDVVLAVAVKGRRRIRLHDLTVDVGLRMAALGHGTGQLRLMIVHQIRVDHHHQGLVHAQRFHDGPGTGVGEYQVGPLHVFLQRGTKIVQCNG